MGFVDPGSNEQTFYGGVGKHSLGGFLIEHIRLSIYDSIRQVGANRERVSCLLQLCKPHMEALENIRWADL